MFPRISQRLFKLCFLATILVFFVIVCFSSTVSDTGLSLYGLDKGYSHYLGGFEAAIQKRFRRIKKNKDRYWLAHTDLTITDTSIELKKFLKNKGELTFESEDSWINQNGLFYDPRFSLSIYLNAIKNKYNEEHLKGTKADSNSKPLCNDLETISLPFNWIDWMDLTDLNNELSKPMQDRINCDYIRQRTNNDPNPDYFCYDNAHYSNEEIKAMGFRGRDQLPGFIIHNHSSHDDRPLNDLRIFEAKCYALAQNLPKPSQVIILNKQGGTYEFKVSNPNNERLITSDLIHYYAETNSIDVSKISDKEQFVFNPVREFTKLTEEIAPRHLTEKEDVNGMYKILKQSDPTVSKEIALSQSMFHYSRQQLLDQINSYESQNIETLPENEKMYYDSLKYCSKFENEADEETYFKMAVIRIDDEKNRDQEWGWHYDWRFFNGALHYDREGWSLRELNYRSNIILDRLLRNWNRFAEEKGIISWIMHGPLLSWYWDGLMFPFDLDIDIQMPVTELVRLAKEFNQTLIVEDPTEGYGKYLIDVGTFIHNRDISTKSNHIDARVVDVDSGIYIDITGLAKSKANTPVEYNDNQLVNIYKENDDDSVEIYNDRRRHFYTLEQISPLKYSAIGGVPVYIPSVITDRLVFEYPEGLTRREFHGWYFVDKLNLWVHQDQLVKVFRDQDIKNDEGNYDIDKLMDAVRDISDSTVLRLLDSDDELLVEYYLTKELTDFHALERQYLFNGDLDNKALNEDTELKTKYNELVSGIKMSKPLRKPLWDYENLERLKHHL